MSSKPMGDSDQVPVSCTISATDNLASDSGDTIGPVPEPEASEPLRAKRRKVLPLEKVFLDNLPCSEIFEKSYMHRETITRIVVTESDFVVTASTDCHVKFWKKVTGGIEFVKHFRAHLGNLQDLSANWNGSLLCTISDDKSLKVFDVINFDLINMLKFEYVPGQCEWIHTKADALRTVAVTDQDSCTVFVYDGLGRAEYLKAYKTLHQGPVTCIRYSPCLNVVVSGDNRGFLEYWRGGLPEKLMPSQACFESKFDTDLFELVNCQAVPTSIAFTKDGQHFAVMSSDRKVRVFRFSSGRLIKVLDETLKTASDMQQERPLLSNMEFGRRIAVERELEKGGMLRHSNLVFDESGHFLLYSTLLGIKVVNLVTNRCVRILGKGEALRPLAIALYQV